MFTPAKATPDFTKKILVLPVVSAGNVPQLASDLLVASIPLQLAGYLDSSCLIPVIGGREASSHGVSTPLEVYTSDESPIAVLQQRSPVLKSKKDEFISSILKWVQEAKFSALIILSAAEAADRVDSQMQSLTYYLTSSSTQGSPALPAPFSDIASFLPVYSTTPAPENLRADDSVSPGPTVPFIPGGGLSRRLLSATTSASLTIPTCAIVHFVFEGDNRPDAAMLLSVLNRLLSLGLSKINEPESWKQGLFGGPHDGLLFD